MYLIMSDFPSEELANKYAEKVNTDTNLKAKVYMDVDKVREETQYQFKLIAPIVLVSRGELFDEAWAQSLVFDFGGKLTKT